MLFGKANLTFLSTYTYYDVVPLLYETNFMLLCDAPAHSISSHVDTAEQGVRFRGLGVELGGGERLEVTVRCMALSKITKFYNEI